MSSSIFDCKVTFQFTISHDRVVNPPPLSLARTITGRHAQAFGLDTREESGIGGSLNRHSLDSKLPKPRRVYGHRTGAAFVRVAPGGFVFIANLHGREAANGQVRERDARLEWMGFVVWLVQLVHAVVR